MPGRRNAGAGRGSGALQLSLRCGDDPLLARGGPRTRARRRSVDWDRSYALNPQPLECVLGPRRAGNVSAGSPHTLTLNTPLCLWTSIQVGLKVLVQRARRFSPTTRLLVERFIPFPAVGEFTKASSGRWERLNPLLR